MTVAGNGPASRKMNDGREGHARGEPNMEGRQRGNIVLVGFMGTGKTTVGKLAARRLDLDFVDMDDVITERAGKAISRIFAEDGEPRFRAMERALVRELSARKGLLVAAGGGIVLNADNIADFSRSGLVVCLTATPETILRRVSAEKHRPLLEGGEKERKILGLLESRRELYAAIPHRIDTTGLAPDQVVERLVGMADR